MLIPTTLPNLFIHSATYVVRIVAIRYTQLIRYIQLYVRGVLVIKLRVLLGKLSPLSAQERHSLSGIAAQLVTLPIYAQYLLLLKASTTYAIPIVKVCPPVILFYPGNMAAANITITLYVNSSI